MPTFKNQDNITNTLVPPGDYIFRVVGMEAGLQTQGKTQGSPFWEFKLLLEGKGAVVYEKLIDHPDCSWKIDTFLKSTNAAPPLNAAFEFVETTAEAAGCLWIDPIGLRGWAHVVEDTYTPKGKTEARKVNRIGTFLTDRPKLARHVEPQEAPASAPTPANPETTDENDPF